MYDKCYFCLDQLPKLKKESTASLLRKFWRSRGTKEPAYITVIFFLMTNYNLTLGWNRDHSKRLLAAFNAELCGFRREGQDDGGGGQVRTEHPGSSWKAWKAWEAWAYQLLTQARRTFYGFKKLLGRKVGDPRVTEEMSR